MRGREQGRDRREHVALRGGVVAGDEADLPRQQGQPALPLRRKEAFGCELLLQPLDRRQVVAEPEPLERQGAKPELATCLVQLRAAEDVDVRAVAEVEPQRVELPARHRDAEARTVARVLEREEHGLPAVVALELGDLAFDPDRGQARKPGRDAAVERAD